MFPLLLQVYALLVLIASLFLYAYNFPYKSKVANILEVVLQLNFLILLLLEYTLVLREDLFVFSGDTSVGVCDNNCTNISYIVILLAPVYYMPLVLFSAVATGYLVLRVKRSVYQ